VPAFQAELAARVVLASAYAAAHACPWRSSGRFAAERVIEASGPGTGEWPDGTGPNRRFRRREGRAGPSQGGPRSALHDVEGLEDRDVGAALEDRASLGERRRLVEGVGLQDRVPTGRRLRVAHRAASGDLLDGRGEGVAGVDNRLAELGEPAIPGLHDLGPLLVRLRHAAGRKAAGTW